MANEKIVKYFNRQFSVQVDVARNECKGNKDRVDISFEDISYSVRTGILNRKWKQIIWRMSGHFKAGELTAIMGQSGAGKTGLMDILAGYTHTSSGQIRTNSTQFNAETFKTQMCYIMQDDILQPLLTVAEAMRVSAKLKLRTSVDKQEKRVNELIRELGLEDHKNTKTGELSGGQRKRLAIGLEIIPEPPVMFLDEPTSGLDSSAALQLMLLLRKFAQEGRTVIISCHQPNGKILNCIDSLYCMSSGRVVYSGTPANLLPYLSGANIECPLHHSPIEELILYSSFKEIEEQLVKCCNNGKDEQWKNPIQVTQHQIYEDSEAIRIEPSQEVSQCNGKSSSTIRCKRSKSKHHLSLQKQICVLFIRAFKILIRDFSSTWSNILISFMVAMLIGTLFYDVGSDATNAYSNYRFICMCLMFSTFTAFNSVIVKFPLEMPTIRREHFNSWYTSGAYFTASLLASLPLQVFNTTIFGASTYIMTGQPRDFDRMFNFLLVLTMIALIGTALGLLTGASFDVKEGMIMGCIFMVPWLVFSGVFLRKIDAPSYLQWMFTISYMRHAIVGLCNSIYAGRGKMKCDPGEPDEIGICPFPNSKYLMKELDIPEQKVIICLFYMSIVFTLILLGAFFAFRFRLSHRKHR